MKASRFDGKPALSCQVRRCGLALSEVAVTTAQLGHVVEAIQIAANINKIGDGKIFVYDLEIVTRIWTGELDGDTPDRPGRLRPLVSPGV